MAANHQAPHQDAFVGQHAVVAVARVFKGDLVSVQQVRVHDLEGNGTGERGGGA